MTRTARPRVLLASLVVFALSAFGAARAADPPPERPDRRIRAWPIAEMREWNDGSFVFDSFFSMYRSSRTPEGRSRWLVPFYWSGSSRADDSSYTVLAPFWYSGRSGDTSQSLMAPLWYAERAPGKLDFYSLPVSFGRAHNERGAVASWCWVPGFLPLYGSENEHGRALHRAGIPYVFDLGRREVSYEEHSVSALHLLPELEDSEEYLSIFSYRRRPDAGKTRAHLLPLAWYASRHGGTSGSLTVLPFLYHRSWTPSTTSDVIGPVLGYRTHTDERHRSWWALLGLVANGRNDDSRWTWFEPFFNNRSWPGGGSWHALHMYGYTWNDESGFRAHRFVEPLARFESWPNGDHTSWVFPVYFDHRRGDSRTQVLFPLYYAHKDATEEQRIGFPLYWDFRAGADRSFLLLPFYVDVASPPERTRSVLGPVYVDRIHGFAGSEHSRSVLWPMFEWSTSPAGWHFHGLPLVWLTREGEHRFDLVAPFYLGVRDGATSHQWVFPVWGRYQRTNDDIALDRSFWALGSVIQSTRTRTDGARLSDSLTLLGGLGGYHRNHAGEHTSAWLHPLWYRKRSLDDDIDWFLPALYYRRAAPGPRSLTIAGLNLWVDYATEKRRERGVLYPLTRHVTRYHEGEPVRTSLDAMLLYGQESDSDGLRSMRLSPLLYVGQREEPSTLAQFTHLVSHQSCDDGRRSETAVMPLLYRGWRNVWSSGYWALLGLTGHVRSGDSTATWALPLYYRHANFGGVDGDTTRSRLLVFPFYYQSRAEWPEGARNSFSVLYPLYSYTRDSIADTREHSSLFGCLKLERGPQSIEHRIFPVYSYSRSSAHRDYSLSLLYSDRSEKGGEVGGYWTGDGFWGLQVLRHSRGEHTNTWALNPLLYGFQRNTERNEMDWRAGLFLADGHRDGDRARYQVLGMVGGSDTPAAKSFRMTPLVHTYESKLVPLPAWRWQSLAHLWTQEQDAGRNRWSVLGGALASGYRSRVDGDRDFRVLYRFVESGQRGDFSEFHVRPLVSWEDEPSTGYYYRSFGGFLYRSWRDSKDAPAKRRVLGFIPI